jgi:hypothetical protein
LGAIARNGADVDMHSVPGAGTVLAASVWNAPGRPDHRFAGISRPMTGEERCGDGYAAREVDGRRQLLLCDGLGHGPLARAAADAVEAAFATAPEGGVADTLAFIHNHIRHTRGAVAGIAELDPSGGVIRFAGIGNVTAVVLDGGPRRAMVSLPGILGHQQPQIRQYEYALPPDALFVMHSDGLTDRWDLAAYPGLISHSPVLIAATLLRDAGTRRDDASVVVATSR